MWLDTCLHKVRFPINRDMISFLATEARVKYNCNSAWTVRIETPEIEQLCRYLDIKHMFFSFPTNGSSQRVIKGLIILHIRILHVCDYSRLSYINFIKTNLVSGDSKFAPWLGNCLFWFADQNIPKRGKALASVVQTLDSGMHRMNHYASRW